MILKNSVKNGLVKKSKFVWRKKTHPEHKYSVTFVSKVGTTRKTSYLKFKFNRNSAVCRALYSTQASLSFGEINFQFFLRTFFWYPRLKDILINCSFWRKKLLLEKITMISRSFFCVVKKFSFVQMRSIL